jgi:type II secretory pathway component PulC
MKLPAQAKWLGVGMCAIGLGVAGAQWFTGVRHPTSAPARAPTSGPEQPPTQMVATLEDPEATDTEASLAQVLRLRGTWWGSVNPQEAVALIEHLQRHQAAFLHLGDHIGPWELVAVEPGQVLFRSPDGEEFRLESPAARRGAAQQEHLEALSEAAITQAAEAITVLSEQERIVDREQVLDTIQGKVPQLLLSLGRVLPHLDAGRLTGFRITRLASSPFAAKLGLQTGDIITTVNGRRILDPRNIEAIFTAILSDPDVEVTLQRAGQPFTLHYQMAPPPTLRSQGSP